MSTRPRLLGFVVALVLLFVSLPALAQTDGDVTDDDVNRVARQLYCPQCENVTLDVCGTKACIDWKQEIRQYMEDGWTDQEIIDYFVAQYGQRVLAEPSDPTISLLLAVVPIAALVVGAIAVVWLMRKGGRAEAPPQPARVPAAGDEDWLAAVEVEDDDDDEDYRARLERELDEVS